MFEVPQAARQGLAYAQALWPRSFEASSEAVLLAWAPSLSPYNANEVRAALQKLATTHPNFPPLVAVMALLREARITSLREAHATKLLSGGFAPQVADPNAPGLGPIAIRTQELLREGLPLQRALVQAQEENPWVVGDGPVSVSPLANGVTIEYRAEIKTEQAPQEVHLTSEEEAQLLFEEEARVLVESWENHTLTDEDMRALPEPMRTTCRQIAALRRSMR